MDNKRTGRPRLDPGGEKRERRQTTATQTEWDAMLVLRDAMRDGLAPFVLSTTGARVTVTELVNGNEPDMLGAFSDQYAGYKPITPQFKTKQRKAWEEGQKR